MNMKRTPEMPLEIVPVQGLHAVKWYTFVMLHGMHTAGTSTVALITEARSQPSLILTVSRVSL